MEERQDLIFDYCAAEKKTQKALCGTGNTFYGSKIFTQIVVRQSFRETREIYGLNSSTNNKLKRK